MLHSLVGFIGWLGTGLLFFTIVVMIIIARKEIAIGIDGIKGAIGTGWAWLSAWIRIPISAFVLLAFVLFVSGIDSIVDNLHRAGFDDWLYDFVIGF